jgi:outer membrane protein assembly factor BamA
VRRRTELAVPDSLAGRPGGDRSFDEAVARARVYGSFRGPGFADHVLALELAGGAARGAGADAFHFDVGGASGVREPFTGYGLFGGGPLLFPVRGYVDGDRSGRYAWTASAEWRFPLALVNRGAGLVPLHLDRLHGALFVDAGNAWGPELGQPGYDRPRERALVGSGGELRADFLTLFTIPLAIRVGAAAPLVDGDGVRVYVRFGSVF